MLAQFVAQWDASRDGTVTYEEFENYYSSVSASIDSDDYFEVRSLLTYIRILLVISTVLELRASRISLVC